VGVGDLCPYCGFPRPKLAEELENTGQIPRIRAPKAKPPKGLVRQRTLGVVIALACIVALIVAGALLFRPRTTPADSVTIAGTIPDQPNPPNARWSHPRSELFQGLGALNSLRFYEPGRYDEDYASTIIASARDAAGRNQLIAVNMIDGSVRWRISARSGVICADRPVLGGIACIFDAQLRVLALDDGQVTRTYPAHVTSRALVVTTTSLVTLSGRSTSDVEGQAHLQGFSFDGQLIWSDSPATTGSDFGLVAMNDLVAVTGAVRTDGTPLVYGSGPVSLPAGEATLLPSGLIAVTSGEERTSLCSGDGKCGAEIDGVPVVPRVRDDAEYPVLTTVPTEAGFELRAYDENGRGLWTQSLTDPYSLAVCGGSIIRREAESISALAPNNGEVSWSAAAAPGSTSVWCDGSRAMTLTDAGLSAFTVDSGETAWQWDLPDGRPQLIPTTAGLLAIGDTWIGYD
jgi:hypothetical protein